MTNPQFNLLIPPQWKSIYLPIWFQEDFPGLDVSSAIVGDSEASAQILFKSGMCILSGKPFVDEIFAYVNCRVAWYFEEGQFISCAQPVAKVSGPACSLLRAERIALNLLARCSSISTNAHQIAESTSAHLAGTRKTTPGFRLFEKYALAVAGVDTHRLSCTDCIMIKDNHVDLLGGDISNAIDQVKAIAPFTAKIEVECRTINQAETAIKSGADIVMLDNIFPSINDLQSLARINPKVVIELSGGITDQNVSLYQFRDPIVISLGALTHSIPPLLDFSFKIIKLQ